MIKKKLVILFKFLGEASLFEVYFNPFDDGDKGHYVDNWQSVTWPSGVTYGQVRTIHYRYTSKVRCTYLHEE